MRGVRQSCRQILGYQIPDVYLYPYHNLENIKQELTESYLISCCRHKLNPDFKIYFEKADCEKLKKDKTIYDILIEASIPQKKFDFHFNGRFIEKSLSRYWVSDESKNIPNFTNIKYSELDLVSSAGVIVFDKTDKEFTIPICEEVYFIECDLFLNSNLNEFAPIVEDNLIKNVITLKIKSNLEEYFFPKNSIAIENKKIYLLYDEHEFEVGKNSLLTRLNYKVDPVEIKETSYKNAIKTLGYYRMNLSVKTDFENTPPTNFPEKDFSLEFLELFSKNLYINDNFCEYFVQSQNYIFKSDDEILARLTLDHASLEYQNIEGVIVKLEESQNIKALRRLRKRPLIVPEIEYTTEKIPFENVFKETLSFSDFTINYLVK